MGIRSRGKSNFLREIKRERPWDEEEKKREREKMVMCLLPNGSMLN